MQEIQTFNDARKSACPQERLTEVRRRSRIFRQSMLSGPQVKYYQSFDLIRVPYPTKYGLRDAYKGPSPFLHIVNRLFIVQFREAGVLKTLLISPSDIDGNAETPFFKGLRQKFGPMQGLGTKLMAPRIRTVEEALKLIDLRPEHVDYISYDHLHTQDLRKWLGDKNTPGYFPNAKLLVTTQEWQSARSLLPIQSMWYCPHGLDNVPTDKIVQFDGDVMLGDGIALIRTPGHTEGNHSFVVHADEALFVTSENGVGADAYAPDQSEIPGLKKFAHATGTEVILNGNTLEGSVDQYISMIQEKEIAGASKRDSRFPNVACSSEFSSYWAFPGVSPTFYLGEFKFGEPQIL